MTVINPLTRVLDRINNLEKNMNQHFDRLEQRFASCSMPIHSSAGATQNHFQPFDILLEQIRTDIKFIEYIFKSIWIVSSTLILSGLFQLFFLAK